MLRDVALPAVLTAAAAGCGGDATAPSPSMLIKVTPDTLATLSPDVTRTITGADFGGSLALLSKAVGYANGRQTLQVVWSVNGHETPLVTTYFSDQALTAVVPAGLLAQPVVAQVFVETGDPMGDLPPTKSPSARFAVTP